ncbi:MAG: acetyl-CoA acetyltransferase [Lautropia sp.]
MTALRSQACIVGIGETEYRRWGGFADRSELQLACEAICAACADAGLEVEEVDGLCSYGGDRNEPSFLQDALGLPRLRYATLVWGGGGAGACGAILHAATAVESGTADHVVVLRALCQGQGRRYGRFNPARAGNNFLAPFGMFSPPIMLAPLVQRYMHEFAVRQECLGEVVLTCRDNASRNPRAVMGARPLTMAQYLASRPIASPLRLHDCCQESDGACALLITTLERARDLAKPPVRILAAAQGNNPGWGTGALGTHNMPVTEYGSGNGAAVARAVYDRAGLRPSDIDVAQFYDHFSGMVLMSLENYGFCGRGEGGAFVDAGGIRWPDGELPINTSGGHLAEAYLHGLNLAIEGVRQMRGTSTSQAAGARTCLVTAGSGVAITSAAILGRD